MIAMMSELHTHLTYNLISVPCLCRRAQQREPRSLMSLPCRDTRRLLGLGASQPPVGDTDFLLHYKGGEAEIALKGRATES